MFATGWSLTSTGAQTTTNPWWVPGFPLYGTNGDLAILVIGAVVVIAVIGAWKMVHRSETPSIEAQPKTSEATSLVCPKCGAHLSARQKFCRECGTTIK